MSGPLIVIDTGVVVRALLGSVHASSYKVMQAAGTGTVSVALSDEGLRELDQIVRRRESLIPGPYRAFEITNGLWLHGDLYRPQRYDWPSVPDSDDYWQPDLAWEATADFIIAWDPHLLNANLPFPVEIITPASLLSRLP